MTATSRSGAGSQSHPRILEAILWGGTVAGIMDITYALTQSAVFGVTPMRLLQAVASGVLGRGSFSGGLSSAALGLGLHFFIAFSVAVIYVLASLKLPLLRHRPLIAGPIYGVIVYWIMQLVVLPLSNFNQGPFTLFGVTSGHIAHIFCVGLPIALATKRTASPAWRTITHD